MRRASGSVSLPLQYLSRTSTATS
uniref:Uncharacterized protein n=1 Tax=Arundo donax TaxID=35708 RepID=A0A0A9G8J0_ARUDO